MSNKDIEGAIGKSLRGNILTALIVCAVLVFGLGGVAAYAEISGAVIGSGKIILEGRTKQVQHPDGGIIGEILVDEGQIVEGGDVLFRLDGTAALANLAIIESQLEQLLAQEARLIAEQARAEEVVYPEELLDRDEPRILALLEGQDALRATRRQNFEGRQAQLSEQVGQYHEQIKALEAQSTAVGDNLGLLAEQISDFAYLHSKGLLVDSKLSEVQRERASLIGSQASIAAEIVEIHQAITQTKLQRVQVEEEYDEKILTESDQKRTEIAQLQEERVTARDRLNRLDIRAPREGYLHELNVHTIGGIISAGETLVSIIPTDDLLLVEAELSPTDVDQVYAGQNARIRLTGLNQRVTPELSAQVIDVSADLMTDEQTGTTYYLARLRIDENAKESLGSEELRPGMPAEVFIQTTMRTIMSYLIKPISDQLNHAMREG
ncbi:MAG: HlyD family type I secretion periplasmic adaptor subunit [Pseudomonadota bacterium]